MASLNLNTPIEPQLRPSFSDRFASCNVHLQYFGKLMCDTTPVLFAWLQKDGPRLAQVLGWRDNASTPPMGQEEISKKVSFDAGPASTSFHLQVESWVVGMGLWLQSIPANVVPCLA